MCVWIVVGKGVPGSALQRLARNVPDPTGAPPTSPRSLAGIAARRRIITANPEVIVSRCLTVTFGETGVATFWELSRQQLCDRLIEALDLPLAKADAD